jgi:hypothetical protein
MYGAMEARRLHVSRVSIGTQKSLLVLRELECENAMWRPWRSRNSLNQRLALLLLLGCCCRLACKLVSTYRQNPPSPEGERWSHVSQTT